MTTATDVRLKSRYRSEIKPALKTQFGFKNPMQVPSLVKIVVNMGVGEAARDSKLIEGAIRDLATITGQKPQVTKSQINRAVQTPRRYANWSTRNTSRRSHVGVCRPTTFNFTSTYP